MEYNSNNNFIKFVFICHSGKICRQFFYPPTHYFRIYNHQMHFFYFDLFAVIIQEVVIVVVVVEGVMVASDVGDDKFDIWNYC